MGVYMLMFSLHALCIRPIQMISSISHWLRLDRHIAVQEAQDDLKEDAHVEWISYWKPNVTINLVDDFTRYTGNAIPPIVPPYMNIESTTGNYYPTILFNGFWLLGDKLIALNESVSEVPLNLEVSPMSMTKWQLFLQIGQSFQVHRSYGSMLEGESDELKSHQSVCLKNGQVNS